MNPGSPIKLVSELLDLPLLDSEGKYCGIVDDVEFTGGAGKDLKLKALLVGPGAYERRMPDWIFWLVRKIAGDRLIRVPVDRVRTIGAVVNLDCAGRDLGLQRDESRTGQWIPHKGAM
jgi:sporulation protein YlmC with PRC-barrel domain